MNEKARIKAGSQMPTLIIIGGVPYWIPHPGNYRPSRTEIIIGFVLFALVAAAFAGFVYAVEYNLI
jgi:hypothetical protein